MSILIKGMMMPENCLLCQFHGFAGYKNEFIVCSLTGRSEGQLSNVPDCPLVEVPTPHGRLIDADALSARMYHEAFEVDSDMQKWDSGCWIRYKMFERIIGTAPTVIDLEE